MIAALEMPVSDPKALGRFYCDVLGMRPSARNNAIAVGYGDTGASLEFRRSDASPYIHQKTDRYWKIAITVPDLDIASAQLAARGIEVTEPHQFRDIAYMAHLSDPEGHIIELIQHRFKDHPKPKVGDRESPLGGGAEISLITLRTNDIHAEMKHCRDQLGMTYLSRQALTDIGFDLYFFALTKERPPFSDVNAVGNREWLWQRPYTVLEFQHLLGNTQVQAGACAPSVRVEHETEGTVWI